MNASRSKIRIAIGTLAVAATLAACGGETLAILGTLGAGGGDWLVDANPNVGSYDPRSDCGAGGNELCRININPGSLYERNYAVVGGGNFGGCAASPAGQVSDAVDVSIPGCFTGKILSVNEAVSSDGQVRAYFDFFPDMSSGSWVDIHDDAHRFVFDDGANGSCEIAAGGAKRPLTFTIQPSNFADFANGGAAVLIPKTTVQSLIIATPTVRTFSGAFVGASGLRLTRSGETIELQRRDVAGSCA